jgi:hypothetical protein
MKNLRISFMWFLLSLVALGLFLNELDNSLHDDSRLVYKIVIAILCLCHIPLVTSAFQLVTDSWKEKEK